MPATVIVAALPVIETELESTPAMPTTVIVATVPLMLFDPLPA
jgi:hypothetical protein